MAPALFVAAASQRHWAAFGVSGDGGSATREQLAAGGMIQQQIEHTTIIDTIRSDGTSCPDPDGDLIRIEAPGQAETARLVPASSMMIEEPPPPLVETCVSINRSGNVLQSYVVTTSGYARFDAYALQAIRRRRFPVSIGSTEPRWLRLFVQAAPVPPSIEVYRRS